MKDGFEFTNLFIIGTIYDLLHATCSKRNPLQLFGFNPCCLVAILYSMFWFLVLIDKIKTQGSIPF